MAVSELKKTNKKKTTTLYTSFWIWTKCFWAKARASLTGRVVVDGPSDGVLQLGRRHLLSVPPGLPLLQGRFVDHLLARRAEQTNKRRK